jgi:hypothetical protein
MPSYNIGAQIVDAAGVRGELERSLRNVAEELGSDVFNVKASGRDILVTAVFNLRSRRDAEELQEAFKRRAGIPPDFEVIWSITDWPGGVAASD